MQKASSTSDQQLANALLSSVVESLPGGQGLGQKAVDENRRISGLHGVTNKEGGIALNLMADDLSQTKVRERIAHSINDQLNSGKLDSLTAHLFETSLAKLGYAHDDKTKGIRITNPCPDLELAAKDVGVRTIVLAKRDVWLAEHHKSETDYTGQQYHRAALKQVHADGCHLDSTALIVPQPVQGHNVTGSPTPQYDITNPPGGRPPSHEYNITNPNQPHYSTADTTGGKHHPGVPDQRYDIANPPPAGTPAQQYYIMELNKPVYSIMDVSPKSKIEKKPIGKKPDAKCAPGMCQ